MGVFAHVDIEAAIKRYPDPVAPTAAALHAYLRLLYARLLANPAVSGITAGAHWSRLAPSASSFDWSYLDDVFLEADAANKSVQLIITPGFDSPQWLFSEMTNCGAPPFTATCDYISFATFPESDQADSDTLPLPWSNAYITQWTAFLKMLNTEYGSNLALVAVAVAGPNGASTEIILPSADSGSIQQPGVPADAAWSAILAAQYAGQSAYQNSDQAFIDAWKNTIALFEATFYGVTLIISPDDGNNLPNFLNNQVVHTDNTLWGMDCSSNIKNPLSCEAKTETLSNFVVATTTYVPNEPLVANEKASEVGGMTAASPVTPGNIDVPGVKVLTSLPLPVPSVSSAVPVQLILGGAEFDLAVSDPKTIQQQGCPDFPNHCADLTPEEAAYNTLTVFFNGTPAAANYGGKPGTARVEYVDIDYVDIQYAKDHPCPAKASKTLGKTSLEDLLHRASHDLFEIANEPKPLPPPTCKEK